MAFQEQLSGLQEQLETLLQRIESETGMSPVLAIGIACVLAYLLLRLLWPRPSLKPPPRSAPGSAEQPKSQQLGEITLEELALYDGSDPDKPICVVRCSPILCPTLFSCAVRLLSGRALAELQL